MSKASWLELKTLRKDNKRLKEENKFGLEKYCNLRNSDNEIIKGLETTIKELKKELWKLKPKKPSDPYMSLLGEMCGNLNIPTIEIDLTDEERPSVVGEDDEVFDAEVGNTLKLENNGE